MPERSWPRQLGFIALAVTLGLVLDCCANTIAWNPGDSSCLNQEKSIKITEETADNLSKDKENLMDISKYKGLSLSLAGYSLLTRYRMLSGFSYEPKWGTEHNPMYSQLVDFTACDYSGPDEYSEDTEEGFISKRLDWMPGKNETVYLRRDLNNSGARSRSAEKTRIKSKLRRVAGELGLDPRLAVALGDVESGFNPQAVSPKGAVGVLQLMPRFFCKEPETDLWVLYDPDENIRMGLAYMKNLLERFENDIDLSLAAYNSGPRRVVEAGYAIPSIEETRNYVKRVREAMEKVPLGSLQGRYALSGGSPRTQVWRFEESAFYLD